jgi:RHS repeat-associated protein
LDNEAKGEGNSYDFGARMYDPRIGRWLTIDPFAAKYPNISPYVFVGNMPIIASDPNGKEIIFDVVQKKDGSLVVIVTVNAKMLNESKENYTEEMMKDYAMRVENSIKEIYGASEGKLNEVKDIYGNIVSGSYTTEVHVEIGVAKDRSELSECDHVYILRDDNNMPDEDKPDCKAGAGTVGYAVPGENFMYINKKYIDNIPAIPLTGNTEVGVEDFTGTGLAKDGLPTLERTASHELGHTAVSRAINEGTIFGHYNGWTRNIMSSSTQKHHAGTKITSTQMKLMINSYENGETNKGRQQVDCPKK